MKTEQQNLTSGSVPKKWNDYLPVTIFFFANNQSDFTNNQWNPEAAQFTIEDAGFTSEDARLTIEAAGFTNEDAILTIEAADFTNEDAILTTEAALVKLSIQPVRERSESIIYLEMLIYQILFFKYYLLTIKTINYEYKSKIIRKKFNPILANTFPKRNSINKLVGMPSG